MPLLGATRLASFGSHNTGIHGPRNWFHWIQEGEYSWNSIFVFVFWLRFAGSVSEVAGEDDTGTVHGGGQTRVPARTSYWLVSGREFHF